MTDMAVMGCRALLALPFSVPGWLDAAPHGLLVRRTPQEGRELEVVDWQAKLERGLEARGAYSTPSSLEESKERSEGERRGVRQVACCLLSGTAGQGGATMPPSRSCAVFWALTSG